jgi:hypothetical protein
MSIAVTANRPKSVKRVTLYFAILLFVLPETFAPPLKLEIRATNVYAKLSKEKKCREVSLSTCGSQIGCDTNNQL